MDVINDRRKNFNNLKLEKSDSDSTIVTRIVSARRKRMVSCEYLSLSASITKISKLKLPEKDAGNLTDIFASIQ